MTSDRRYLDLMECCRLDVDRIEAEQGESRMNMKERTRTESLRALVVGLCRINGCEAREIMWPSLICQIVAIRYLIPVKLTE